MKIKEFDYKLPNALIAIEPNSKRDKARLLVLDKSNGVIEDSHFDSLPKHLKAGDVLVFNDSKVIPARLFGLSRDKEFEILLIKKRPDGRWECWLKPGRKAKIGAIFTISQKLQGTLIKREKDIFILEFNLKDHAFDQEIEAVGEMPIPPYILKEREKRALPEHDYKDAKNYQTIFANQAGSVAAPTAGLHFNEQLVAKLNKNGIQIEKVTLHVSLGTFQPITTERVEDFEIHRESFAITAETALRLNQAKQAGRRIIAVGTTAVRVLESATVEGVIRPSSGETKIYIYPGYKFVFVDGLITNFHLPKSSLLLLVSALVGKKTLFCAYEHAISEKYLFYSYGDGMLII